MDMARIRTRSLIFSNLTFQDVWCHIHSLMPMRDAARTACVSRAFLRSWRCHPNLVFDIKTLGLDKIASGHNKIARVFSSKVDQILKNHIGIGVKRLKIELKDYNEKDSPHLDRWLQIAVTPGIEELTLSLPIKSQYNFPHSLLCNGSGDTIQSFHLICCSFSPTAELGLLRSLTRLHLQYVCITGHKLEHFLSDSFALEHLKITFCDEIVRLKVPYVLQRLSYLHVGSCQRLQMIDIEAPNISNLYVSLEFKAQLSIGEKLQVKDLNLSFSGAVHYACVELPPRVPNLETLSICSWREVANTPMLHSKFPHLRMLMIGLSGTRLSPTYDYFSLVSFLHSCPSLEAFVLDVSQKKRKHVSILTDDSDLRQIQEYGHHKLKMKRVEILGFSSAKSLVELTGHIVESAMSVECITLDASQCFMKCWSPNNKSGKCFPVSTDQLMEARRALLAIRTYVQPKVPSTVKLNVVEPCSRCYDVNQCLEYPVFGSS